MLGRQSCWPEVGPKLAKVAPKVGRHRAELGPSNGQSTGTVGQRLTSIKRHVNGTSAAPCRRQMLTTDDDVDGDIDIYIKDRRRPTTDDR